MLGVGAVGMLGGALALKRKQYGIYIPAIGAVIGIVGSFIPIGNVIYSGTEYPIPLYSTYIIEFILLGLGTGLIGLNKITVRIGADKALELANTIAERNKIKNILSTYLVENKGKAFTAKVIHKRCIEDTHSDVTISETEKMLYELNLIGKVHVSIKDDVYYYFVP
ncbi:MAG: hypothetical protein HWN79_02020 [Candidatus Lokiarchaeota archaeon]|nr:hypothetical protein [Candidatus Lokiarchaeota archaeon]